MRSAVLAGLVPLAACGGDGGGVNSTPAPAAVTPAPTPTPSPTPTPAPSAYDTAEYRATAGAVSMNALAAYNAGATGSGVTLAVIDSGIDTTSAEFAGRISAASQNVAGGSGIAGADGHGTAVGFTAAGRRNGSGVQGVAFDATLLVLRADTPGTCTGATSSSTSGCSFNDDNIARGVDVARTNGARVINISLGGDAAASSSLIAAINRATAAGIVVVVAAGNSGNANPDASAQFANNDAVARNLVIVAGSVGANAARSATGDAISAFSNRAGNTAAHFLAAVGESVLAPDQTGAVYRWSGTSFSTPQISGAVALLAQAFPTLTGAQIVDILYRSARDAGTAGVDGVYGEGVLDLTRAFQPLGTSTVAGSALAVSTSSNAQLSTAMGDATMRPLGAVIIDGYGRAFTLDLAQTIARATPSPVLAPALEGRSRNVALARGGMTAAVTLAPRGGGDWAIAPTALTARDALAARAVAGSVTQKLGAGLSVGFAYRQETGTLAAQLGGLASPAFLVARDDGLGFDTAARATSAIRQEVAGFGVTVASETGDVLSRREALIAGKGQWRRDGYARTTLAVDRRIGALAVGAGLARLEERGTLLGAHFDPSLGAMRAASWMADLRARWQPGGGWALGGMAHAGWTRAAVGGALAGGGQLRTAAFAVDAGKAGVLGGGDSVGVRVASPPRVVGGGVDLTLPTGWDYDTGAVSGWTTARMTLTPGGHELDVEARYARPWLGGLVETNLFWRRDPGNIAALPPDYGLALRYAVGF